MERGSEVNIAFSEVALLLASKEVVCLRIWLPCESEVEFVTISKSSVVLASLVKYGSCSLTSSVVVEDFLRMNTS